MYGEITPGKMIAALLQASDMYHPQFKEFEKKPLPTVITVGVDQDPHIRLARDIARRFDKKLIPISSSYHFFLPGLKGGKMSASDPNSFIAFTDNPGVVKKKINKYAFSGGQETVEEHRKKGGNPDIDVSFQYLKLFEEDDKKLNEIYNNYKSGQMLTGELKKIAIDKINAYLEPIQKKYKDSLKKVREKFN
jgi:tryptophanyl-tRNA synthetase